MVFSSFEFFSLLLTVSLTAYYLTPFRHENWGILQFSRAFHPRWCLDVLALSIGVTVLADAVARGMDVVDPRSRRGRRLLILGLVGDLSALACVGYAHFGVATFDQFVGTMGLSNFGWSEIVLPIGLTFHALQSVSCRVDIRPGDVPVSPSFLNDAVCERAPPVAPSTRSLPRVAPMTMKTRSVGFVPARRP